VHRLIAAYAAELRSRPHPSAQAAAALLEALADQRAEGAGGGYVPPHLEVTLAAREAHPLTALFAEIAHQVPWVKDSGFPMPPAIRGRYCYCDIVGPEAPVRADDICFGAYLQFPDSWYPFHWHAAEELYFPLSGTAQWSRDGVRDQPEPPGTLIRHASLERHATRTGPEPMLAFWIWLGDLDGSTYGIDAA
jgi:hypothetical protein